MIKTLKYLIAVAVVIACGMSANAQFRYGPVAGATFTTLKFKQDLVPVSGTTGFQAGVQTEMMFPGIGFGIDFGLIYNMEGANISLGDKLMWSSQGYGREHLYVHMLNIPFHLRFKYSRMQGFEDVLMPFVYGGPEFNIMAGHSKCDAMQYTGGDISLGVGGGIEIKRRWQISAGYTWGLTYVMKARLLSDYSARSNQWTVRVTYFLK